MEFFGTLSPYPIVSIVTTAKYNASKYWSCQVFTSKLLNIIHESSRCILLHQNQIQLNKCNMNSRVKINLIKPITPLRGLVKYET